MAERRQRQCALLQLEWQQAQLQPELDEQQLQQQLPLPRSLLVFMFCPL